MLFVRRCLSTVLLLAALLLVSPAQARAAVGDGTAVYGESGTGVLRTRGYTNATSTWSAEASATTTSTVVSWVVTKASPVENVAIAASYSDAADDTLYLSRWNGSSWSLDVTDASIADTVTFRRFDLAFEQGDSGNALVVFSNGGTSNELSYYYYVGSTAAWIGPCTLNSNRTSAAVEWVELESSPSAVNPNEMALAFSDANDDLSGFIWTPTSMSPSPATCGTIGSYWTDEASAAFETSLSTTNTKKFNLAYEATSGDVLLAWYPNNTADLKYVTNAGATTGWSAVQTNTTFANAGVDIDLCAEPGSDRIGLGSLTDSATSADTETAIWTGSAWGNISTDVDAQAEQNASNEDIACGWVSTGAGDKLVVVYNDEETTDSDLDWILWNGSTWAVQTDVTYGATVAQERHLHVDTFPGEQKIHVTLTNSASNLWSLKYDGTSWTVLNSNTALEANLPTAVYGAADVALTSYDPTPVAQIANVMAQRDGQTTTVAWDTQTESRVRGFHVARAELVSGRPDAFARVTPQLIPAGGGTMTGQSYRFDDTTAALGHAYAYQVEVIGQGGQRVTQRTAPIAPDVGGRLTHLDPVTDATTVATRDAPVTPAAHLSRSGQHLQWRSTKEGLVVDVVAPAPSRTTLHAKQVLKHTISAARASTTSAPGAGPAALAAVKLAIQAPGLYRVMGSELQAAGWDLSQVTPALLVLRAQGRPVPIRLAGMADGVFDPADYLEFWGEPATTRDYRQQVYWLTQEAAGGPRIVERAAGKRGGSPLSYDAALRLDGDAAYWPESPTNAHWFFDYELWAYGGPNSFDVPLTVDHLVFTGGKARVTVGLQGLSAWGWTDPLHNRQHAVFYLNGTPVGEQRWTGDTYTVAELDVPLKLLVDGENALTIEATDENGALEQFFLVDNVSLTYPRSFMAADDGLIFPAVRKGSVTYQVRQFPSEQALVYIVRDSGQVEFLTGITVTRTADGLTVAVPDDAQSAEKSHGPGSRYVVIPPTAVKTVDAIALAMPAHLRTDPVSSYVIVAPSAFLATLAPFAEHRRATVAALQDIYDEFSYGLPDPSAIRDFLLSASDRGATTALLVGDGHFDPRDFQGSGIPEYVPVAFVPNRYGELPWDGWFATPPGELVPTLLVGRWPVRTVEELDTVMAKTLVYESAGAWGRSVLLADDEPIFRSTQDRLAQALRHPDEAITLYDGELDPATVKSRLLEEWNRGADLLTFAGHGAIQLWAVHRLMTLNDIDALTNTDRYPVVLTLGCLSGYFAYPTGLDCLSERLLTAKDKGTAATLTPAGLTSTPEQQIFGSAWVTALQSGQSLGVALRSAQQAAASQLAPTAAAALIHSFNLLGDPALYLHTD